MHKCQNVLAYVQFVLLAVFLFCFPILLGSLPSLLHITPYVLKPRRLILQKYSCNHQLRCTHAGTPLSLGAVIVLQKWDRYYTLLSVFCFYLAILCKKSLQILCGTPIHSCEYLHKILLRGHSMVVSHSQGCAGASTYRLVRVYC